MTDDVRGKYVPPAVNLTAFTCPHCHALTSQFWYEAFAERIAKNGTPTIIDASRLERLDVPDAEMRERLAAYIARVATGLPSLERQTKNCDFEIANLTVSRCYNCSALSLWIYDRMLWPRPGDAPLAHPDMPDDIRRDYLEASTIFDPSPRAAAALLRLAIQKLCKHLGEAGDNINADIASLVRKGLPVEVQQALDIVRVVGNASVHPGLMDPEDVRATAEKLFGLVNFIVDNRIAQPARIKALSDGLPEGAKQAIEKRDRIK